VHLVSRMILFGQSRAWVTMVSAFLYLFCSAWNAFVVVCGNSLRCKRERSVPNAGEWRIMYEDMKTKWMCVVLFGRYEECNVMSCFVGNAPCAACALAVAFGGCETGTC